MPGRCVVGGCSNGDDRTEAKARRKQLVDFVELKRAKWEPTAASRVCSVHFSNSEDFEAQFSIPGVKRRRELIKDEIGPIPVQRFHRNLWEEEELSGRSRRQVMF